MLQLANWLYKKGKNYTDGVEIFKRLQIDTSKNQYFSVSKPDNVRVNMLWRLMTTYARIHNVKPTPFTKVPVSKPGFVGQLKNTQAAQPKQATKQRPLVNTMPHVNYADMPDHIKTIYDSTGETARLRNVAREKLKLIAEDPAMVDERSTLAKNIVEFDAQLRTAFRAIDDWYAHRNDPEKNDAPVVPTMSDLDKDRRIKANLNYIRRYHGDEPKQSEVQLRMNELEKWGVSYEKLLTKTSAT